MTKFIEILLIAIGTFSNYCAGDIVVLRQTPHKIYIGNVVFETQAVSMWSLCAQLCSRMKICRSINFIQHNKTCQINNAEPEESTALLIDSYGDSFVAASTFPPVSCSIWHSFEFSSEFSIFVIFLFLRTRIWTLWISWLRSISALSVE